ncbi:hypothetical protein [Stutzerimonas nitrititolerans]|uniref:hypothetical protein n=1 Tax=Stutzerimonas nitrititolerans TaxID=2482751 RepID=UPI0028AD0616|nr:hypothetical protein [Stutzerimonas nitrititolerans]
MDVERAVLKAGVTLVALFAVYQGTQGMRQLAKQRSAEIRQDAKTQPSVQRKRPDDYIESLRLTEVERRRSEVTVSDSLSPAEPRK